MMQQWQHYQLLVLRLKTWVLTAVCDMQSAYHWLIRAQQGLS